MPNDVITLNAVSKELKVLLKNGRIEKAHQPEKDELVLVIKNNGKIFTLALSANPSNPRAHITSTKKENPMTATSFCMLIRKHLNGGIIEDVSLLNNDRIIKFTINSKNELNDNVKFYLIAELMGRYSNIIIVKEDYTILDAIKRIGFDESTTRFLMPNLKYTLQPQNKISLEDTEKIQALFENISDFDENFLMQNISGFAKETAKELIYLGKENLINNIQKFYHINESESYLPCLLLDSKGKFKDYFITEYKSIVGQYQHYPSLNICQDEYYKVFDGELRKKSATKELLTLLKRLQTKTQRRISDNNEKLDNGEEADKNREYGELLLSNLYKINKGDKIFTCENYYTGKEENIPLDELLFPKQNAQNYFKKYTKLKRAKEIAAEQLAKLRIQEEYLLSIEAAITNSSTKQEYDEISSELNSIGNLKKPAKEIKKSKQKPSKPACYKIDNYDIYVGKNNLQNIEVTFNLASGADVWLHTKSHHGSHVIIKGSNPPPETVIAKAASLCAYFSAAREAGKVEVDYTQRKNVKKIPAGMTGMVTYTNYKTVLVKPELLK